VEVEKVQREFDVRLEWKSFYLRPDTPAEGSPLPAALRARMMDPDNPLKRRAAQMGLTMSDHDVIPSTRRAHQATKWAGSLGKLDAMHEQLLRRYWTLGEDIGQWPALRAAAKDAELDPDAMQEGVESGAFQADVERDLEEAQQLGIHAVPTFVVGERHAVQGAQEADVFRRLLRQLGATPKSG
jgi:predicted DsbA family dithiol-disulfide isomerase